MDEIDLFGSLEEQSGMQVKRMMTVSQSALLLGWSRTLIEELADRSNWEIESSGKPLGVWLDESIYDYFVDEDDNLRLPVQDGSYLDDLDDAEAFLLSVGKVL